MSAVRTRFEQRIAAPDGVTLAADVYLPPTPGRYPALLVRTPYERNPAVRMFGERPYLPSEVFRRYASAGFVVVASDVRGRGDSDGRFVPFAHERADGAATVDWVAGLDECDGRVGVFGTGYAGFCAWAAAVERPSGLAALATVGAMGAGPGLPARNGVLRLDWLFWLHLVSGRVVQRPDLPRWNWRHLPVVEMDRAIGHEGLGWVDWVEEAEVGVPVPADLGADVAGVDVPALHLAGWWDQHLESALRYWERSAGPERSLVVGPWSHDGLRRPVLSTGGVGFGVDSVVDPVEEVLAWFEQRLGAGPAASPSEATSTGERVRLFVTGRDRWAGASVWPPEPARQVTLWCRSGGRANTARGDGVLAVEAPDQGEPADEYVFDPDRPVPWLEHFDSFARPLAGMPAPPDLVLDQKFAESRDDVLVYTSLPLDEALLVVGRPRVHLVAGTDAEDADFVVALSDVAPDGRSLHLSHDAVRAASKAGFRPPGLLECELAMDAVAHEFGVGHRVRLSVTSSLFPLYARNPGTGLSPARAQHLRRAVQRLEHRTRLVLPVGGDLRWSSNGNFMRSDD